MDQYSRELREVSNLVQRAQKALKGTPLRRDALNRLLKLKGVDHPESRSYAARTFFHFFQDYAELEEDVLNAVYDLCEDTVTRVRKDGYAAITQISRLEKKWIKRNADVLVQLLQSDEPEEVSVVKKALKEHVDLNAAVTFGVFCDTIKGPPDEAMDEDEQETRDRLRSLVLSFLTVDAKRNNIFGRHVSEASKEWKANEEALAKGLISSLPKCTDHEKALVVKDLLLTFPSYQKESQEAKELFAAILDEARLALIAETEGDAAVSISRTRYLTDLAGVLVIEKRLVPPNDFLQFLVTSLMDPSLLRRIAEDDRSWIVARTGSTMLLCEESQTPSEDLGKLRTQVVDVFPSLPEVSQESDAAILAFVDACRPMLQAFSKHRARSGWKLPAPLVTSLREMLVRAELDNQTSRDADLALIKSLLPPPEQPKKEAPATPGPSKPSAAPQPVRNGGKQPRLPNRALAPDGPARKMHIAGRRANKDHRDSANQPVHSIKGAAGANGSLHKRVASDDDGARPPKRPRPGAGGGAPAEGPSLLSRMNPTSKPPAQNVARTHAPPGRLQPERNRNSEPYAARSSPPVAGVMGLSIKGAASKEHGQDASLLNRIDPGSERPTRGTWRQKR